MARPRQEEGPDWDAFWRHFAAHRVAPPKPGRVPPPGKAELARRERIRLAALALVRALSPGAEEGDPDFSAALHRVQDLVDDLEFCVSCRRLPWECDCDDDAVDAAHPEASADDGFSMDRVVLRALDFAGVGLPTWWNGAPAACRRVRVIVGPPPVEGWWSAALEGQERNAVEVRADGRTFYLDDADGTAWALVTTRQGDASDPRLTLPVREVLGTRGGDGPGGLADAMLPLPPGGISEMPPAARKALEQLFGLTGIGSAGGRKDRAAPEEEAPPSPPTPVREVAADAPLGRARTRLREACLGVIDVYHDPPAHASYREVLDEALRILQRERESLG